DLVALADFPEFRRFDELEPDEQADANQQDADKEGNAPTPGEKIRFRKLRHHRKDDRGQHHAERESGLNQAAEEAALPGVTTFDDHQNGATPLASDANTLQ